MKPTSPEDRELEELGADVSARYRAGSNEEPPASLDAAILEAARREAARPRLRRNWRLPAAIAAVLVIGVSLALMTREIVEPLPSLDQRAEEKAGIAKPDTSRLAMKTETKPAVKPKIDLDSRPSRERSARVDRESDLRPGTGSVTGLADQATSQPAAPPAVAPALPAAVPQPEVAAAGKLAEQEQAAASLRDDTRANSLRKEAAVATPVPAGQPGQWLKQIGELVRDGKTSEAHEQLAQFRKRFPAYPLPENLRTFEAETKK